MFPGIDCVVPDPHTDSTPGTWSLRAG